MALCITLDWAKKELEMIIHLIRLYLLLLHYINRIMCFAIMVNICSSGLGWGFILKLIGSWTFCYRLGNILSEPTHKLRERNFTLLNVLYLFILFNSDTAHLQWLICTSHFFSQLDCHQVLLSNLTMNLLNFVMT